MNNYIIKNKNERTKNLDDIFNHIMQMQSKIKALDLMLIKKDLEDLYYVENLGLDLYVNFDYIDDILSKIEEDNNSGIDFNIINYHIAKLLVELSEVRVFKTKKYFIDFGVLYQMDKIEERIKIFEESFGDMFNKLKAFMNVSDEASFLARSIFEVFSSDDVLALTNFNYGITINFDFINNRLSELLNKKNPVMFLQMMLSEIKEEIKEIL